MGIMISNESSKRVASTGTCQHELPFIEVLAEIWDPKCVHERTLQHSLCWAGVFGCFVSVQAREDNCWRPIDHGGESTQYSFTRSCWVTTHREMTLQNCRWQQQHCFATRMHKCFCVFGETHRSFVCVYALLDHPSIDFQISSFTDKLASHAPFKSWQANVWKN